jgi:hypothetical protein
MISMETVAKYKKTGTKRVVQLSTRDGDTGPRYGFLQLQFPVKIIAMTIDGERRPFPTQEVRNVGEHLWIELPAGSKDLCPVLHAEIIGLGSPGEYSGEHLLPFDMIRRKPVPSTVLISPQGNFLLQVDPQVNGKLVRADFEFTTFCTTCGGDRKLGRPGHQVNCPVCDGTGQPTAKLRGSNFLDLWINQLKIGMTSQLLFARSIPFRHLGDLSSINFDMICMGQFLTFDITNRSAEPIALSGALHFEEYEYIGPKFEIEAAHLYENVVKDGNDS